MIVKEVVVLVEVRCMIVVMFFLDKVVKIIFVVNDILEIC